VPELAGRLKELRAQRQADEAEAAQLSILLRAIMVTRRDRDTGSSPALADHRAHLERIWADVESLVCLTARVAVRLHLRGGDSADPLNRRAWQAIQQSRAALAAFGEAVNQA
jgi:hypothetical protein